MKLYVGCGLTRAPEEFKTQVEDLKNRLKRLPEVEVLEFLGLVAGTPREVFVHDIFNCVGVSDIMVAICDEPSTGLGMEMLYQMLRGKTLLAFARRDNHVTRMVQDPPFPCYSYTLYDSFDEIFEVVKDQVIMEMARKATSVR